MIKPSPDQLSFGGDLSPLGIDKNNTSQPSNDKALKLKLPVNGVGRVGGVLDVNYFTGQQLTFTEFNIVLLDKGIELAPNGKGVKKQIFVDKDFTPKQPRIKSTHDDYKVRTTIALQNGCPDFILNSLLDDLELYLRANHNLQRFSRKKYRDGLSMIMANLLVANANNAQVVLTLGHNYRFYDKDPDNPAHITNCIINPVCEFLSEAGYIVTNKGRGNEFDKNASWLIPLEPINEIHHRAKYKIYRHKKSRLGTVKGKNGKLLRSYQTDRTRRFALSKLTAVIESHSQTWDKHSATLSNSFVLPWLDRKFNLNLELGGRFYGDYQNLPKQDRARILIDGEQTIEPDFKSIHFYLLLNF